MSANQAKQGKKRFSSELVETSDSDVSGPRSPKKKNLVRNAAFSEEPEEDHFREHDLDETEAIGDGVIDPLTMLDYVERFNTFLKSNGHETATVSTLSKHADDFLKHEGVPVDAEAFTKSFKKLLTASLRPSFFSISNAIGSIIPYLDQGESVQLYPDFPVRPPSLNVYYAKKNGLQLGIGKLVTDIKNALAQDAEGRRAAEAEVSELEAQFLKELEAFAAAHRDNMRPNHSLFLDNKIKAIRKKMFPVARASAGTPRGLKKKKEVTAFSLFCSIYEKEDKYKNMDPEKRERKLQKKFDNMDSSSKDIYEKIALSR